MSLICYPIAYTRTGLGCKFPLICRQKCLWHGYICKTSYWLLFQQAHNTLWMIIRGLLCMNIRQNIGRLRIETARSIRAKYTLCRVGSVMMSPVFAAPFDQEPAALRVKASSFVLYITVRDDDQIIARPCL